MRKLSKIFTTVATLIFLGASSVYAAPPKLDGVPVVFENAIKAALSFSSLVAVAMVIFAGYTYMTSGGDPQKVQRAQGTLTWAVVGIIFLSISGFLIIAVLDFFSIQ